MQIAILDNLKPERGWFRGANEIFYVKSNVDHTYYKATDE